MTAELKARLKGGGRAIGSFVLSHDPNVVLVADAAGLDFLLIDLEHGTHALEPITHFLNARQSGRLSIFVRCTMEHIPFLGPLLDHGLDGVLVAGATSVSEVQEVVQAVKFAPLGRRGLNPFVADAAYGKLDSSAFMHTNNERTNIWILAENMAIIAALHEVCAVPGVDGVFLGPYDLSVDLQLPGQIDHPEVTLVLRRSIEVIQSHGCAPGMFVKEWTQGPAWLNQGIQCVAVGIDWQTLRLAWETVVKELNHV